MSQETECAKLMPQEAVRTSYKRFHLLLISIFHCEHRA